MARASGNPHNVTHGLVKGLFFFEGGFVQQDVAISLEPEETIFR